MLVPGIALIVGAIVIMNIMLVSVTERTKEIGIRKSIGARQIDILKQFLVEAVSLAILGGAVGIFIAWIIGQVVTAIFFPTYLSLLAILGALGASGGAGVVSGIFPAWKAARLDPIEALRAD
jgi:putative ABC transport system permease protein